MLQVLESILDPTFSSSSFGFRPGRGAHQALAQAQTYVADGRGIMLEACLRHDVVDIDLEKLFDRVNHDVLMSRLARRIVPEARLRHDGDTRLLGITRRFLEAGMMQGDVCFERHEGTPRRTGAALRADADRCRRCSPIFFWTISTRSWSGTPLSGWERHRRNVTLALLAAPLAAIILFFIAPMAQLAVLSVSGEAGLSLVGYVERRRLSDCRRAARPLG